MLTNPFVIYLFSLTSWAVFFYKSVAIDDIEHFGKYPWYFSLLAILFILTICYYTMQNYETNIEKLAAYFCLFLMICVSIVGLI